MSRALLTMVCAAFVGVIAIYAVAPVSAAQDIGPDVSGNSKFQNKLLFERVFEDSGMKDRGPRDMKFNMQYQRPAPYDPVLAESAVDSRYAKSGRAMRALTRGARSVYGSKMARFLVSRAGGLAGVAAGIWINNGVTLYNGLRGEPEPEALVVSAEFRQAELFLEGSSGAGGGVMRVYESGVLVGSAMVTSASYSYWDGKCTARFDYVGWTSSGGNFSKYVGRFGMEVQGGVSSAGTCSGGWVGSLDTTNPSPKTQTVSETLSDPRKTFRFFTADEDGPQAGVRRYFGPLVTQGEGVGWQNPVFDWGSSALEVAPPEYTPPAGDMVSTPEETRTFADTLRGDPDYDPTWDNPRTEEEREKKFGGPFVRKWANPDGSETWKYPDGTTVTRYPDGTTRTEAPPGVETGTPAYPAQQIWEGPQVTTSPTANPDPTQYPEPAADPGPGPDPDPDPPPGEEPPADPDPTDPSQPAPSCETCPTPLKPKLDLPSLNIGSVFPFSLVVYAYQALGSLSGPSQFPTFDLGIFPLTIPPALTGAASLIRNTVGFVGVIGIAWWGWRLNTGKGGD